VCLGVFLSFPMSFFVLLLSLVRDNLVLFNFLKLLKKIWWCMLPTRQSVEHLFALLAVCELAFYKGMSTSMMVLEASWSPFPCGVTCVIITMMVYHRPLFSFLFFFSLLPLNFVQAIRKILFILLFYDI
jgi:hypothetical protein